MFWSGLKKKEGLSKTVACAGCAAKLNPLLLREALASLHTHTKKDENLLVGFNHADDAGVYKISADQALVQTLDFFTPIVDDPVWYGRIAAANSLSDVYAMGGKPLTVMNILCYPEAQGAELMGKILFGAQEKVNEAGATLVGGHSVKDKELKFGMSVTGLINPSRIFSNDQLKPDQVLVLTKKLGTGIATTAAKRGKCPDKLLNEAIHQMATLNNKSCEQLLKTKATACTDVTGFGFLGHLSEMLRASKVGADIYFNQVPVLEGVLDLAKKGFLTGAVKSNLGYAVPVEWADVNETLKQVMIDPQTSGGLLAGIPEDEVTSFVNSMNQNGLSAWVVGKVTSGNPQIRMVQVSNGR